MILLGFLILTQTVLRMASREEKEPMGNAVHQWKVFVLALFEFALAALVNVACGMAATLT